MAKLRIDDYDLHYDYYYKGGDAPTLFLIHELAQDSLIWKPFISYFYPSFNILTYDFFGHGQTTDSAKPPTIDGLIQEALLLIRTLNLKNIHIVGTHFGGFLAILTAKLCQKEISTLTLMSTPFFMPKGVYTSSYQQMKRLLISDRALLPKLFVLGSTYPVTQAKSKYIIQSFQRVKSEIFLDIMGLCKQINDERDFTLLYELRTIDKPVLIMNGEYNNSLPPSLSMAFASLLPKSKMFVVPGAARDIALDNPAEVIKIMQSFIQSAHDLTPVPFLPIYHDMLDDFQKVFIGGYKKNILERKQQLDIQVMDGDFRVYWKDRPVEGKWNQRNAKELLLFIAMHHGTATRDQMIDALIPEMPIVKARNHLRVRLAHLNKLFRDHPDPSARHSLLVSRLAVTLSVGVSCDLADYMDQIAALTKSNEPPAQVADRFLDLVSRFRPSALSALGGEWISRCIDKIETALAHAMIALLSALEEKGLFAIALKVLDAGKSFEPYDGFKKDWLSHIQLRRLKQPADKKSPPLKKEERWLNL